MKRISRIVIMTVFSIFIGIANLAAAENASSEKMAEYSLQEVVCTAERTSSMAEIPVVLPDMSEIGIVTAATDNMLGALDEKEVYVLPEVVCTAERTPSVAEIAVALPEMDNIDIQMIRTDSMRAAIEKEAYVALAPLRRPMRMATVMRPPNAHKMEPKERPEMPFSL